MSNGLLSPATAMRAARGLWRRLKGEALIIAPKCDLGPFRAALTKRFENFADHPMRGIWWEYAETTLDRGRHCVDTISQYAPILGKDCLDVGCAYGGFPVACALAGARRAVGIEIDAQLLELAKALASGAPCNIQLHHGNCLEPHWQNSLGRYDVVTCNDVIEHVDDPYLLMNRLAGWTAPNGVLYMEIPNKDAIDFIFRDGHYGLFGICLLRKDRAIRYYQQCFHEPYTVGEYLELSEYLNGFTQAGYTCNTLHVPAHAGTVAQITEKIEQLRRTYRDVIEKLHVTPETKQELTTAAQRYLIDADSRIAAMHAAPSSAKAEHERRFLERYGLTFWRLLCRKK